MHAVVRDLSDDLILSCNRNQHAYRAFADQLVGDAEPGFPGPLAGVLAGLAVARHAWLVVLACDAPMIERGLLEQEELGKVRPELDGHEIVFVARFPGHHLVNVDIAVGSRLPAYFTASGTAILSRLSEEQRREILAQTRLEPITPYTEVDPEKLLERVRRVAEKGYAIIVNETVLGDISVAAPVIDHRGLAVAAINIAVPTTRWTVARVEAELAPHVQVAATSISKSKFSAYSR